jgi:hypothetical protein
VVQENVALCSTSPWRTFQIQENQGTCACIAEKGYTPCSLQWADEIEKPVEVILSAYHQYTRMIKWRPQVSTMMVAYCALNAVKH